ncbi:MAG: hypothetical protein WAZ21_00135 [Candidatus Saccharimonadales bacterium]
MKMLKDIGKSDELMALLLHKMARRETVDLKIDNKDRKLCFQELQSKGYGIRVRLADEFGTVILHLFDGSTPAQAELTYKPLPKGDDTDPA